MEPIQFWTLIIGIIGAAAWIPQLISLIISIIKKPVVTLIPANHAEIGFTELGPIINIRAAITSDNGDVLIDLIELNIEHESGSIYKFKWHEVSEIKGQLIISGAPNQSAFQVFESEATAIKILKSDLKNLVLRNRMDEHTTLNRKYGYEFIKERRRLVNNNQYSPETFYVSKVVQDLQSFLKSQMVWKKGSYIIKFSINTRDKAEIFAPILTFNLSDEDIVLLQTNSDNMSKVIQNACYADSDVDAEKLQPVEWHWLDKELIKTIK